MKIRTAFVILFGGIISVNLIILTLLFIQLDAQNEQYEGQVNRFNSFGFSADLRESSNDLTAFARNFVITGDSIWSNMYWDVVLQREGELISDTHRQSVLDSMSHMGFVEEEFELLKTAVDRSNELVEIEREAMNASVGLFKDEEGMYTRTGNPDVDYAIDLLFNDAYTNAQQKIMEPIDRFEELIEFRTKTGTQKASDFTNRLLIAIIVFIIFVIISSVVAYFLIDKRIKKEEQTQSKLNQSQLQFKSLVNSLPGVIYNCDLDDPWEMYFMTDEIEKLTGYPKEDFLGKNPKRTFGEIMHPDDRDEASQLVQKAISANQSYSLEYRVKHLDGRTLYVNGYGKAIHGIDGSPDFLVGGIFNDTDRLAAIADLKESEERFQLAARGSNAGIWDLDVASGKAFWSDIHYQLLDYEVGEVEPSLEFIRGRVYKDDLAMFDKTFDDHMTKGTILEFEARFYTKNGKLKWFASRGASSRDKDGKSTRIVGTFTDVTERKQVQEELAAKEQQLQYAFDVSNEGIWEWNHKWDTVMYSSRCFNILGYKPVVDQDETAQFWKQVIVKDDANESLMLNLDEVKNTGVHDNICRMVAKSNETKWIHTKGKAVEFLDDGKPARIVGTMSDITQRMKQEEEVVNAILETEDKERSRIARDIHDGLQQTMSTALMSFEKVRSSVDFEDKNIYEKFHQGYQFLKKSIEESRTLAHNLMPKVIGKSGIVAGIESLISAIKGSTSTEFVFEQNLNDERLKLSEEMTFYRIIQESINNVIKYANAAKCHIQLLKYDDVIILTIEDDGDGFDKSKHQNTFGLNSMKTRSDSIGAYFELNSQIGRGTQILVELPLKN